jgi:hypothetical protein
MFVTMGNANSARALIMISLCLWMAVACLVAFVPEGTFS